MKIIVINYKILIEGWVEENNQNNLKMDAYHHLPKIKRKALILLFHKMI